MNRSKTLMQIVVAIAAGLGASAAAAKYLAAEPPKPMVKVLIAKQHINAFTKLQRDQFDTREMPEDQALGWMREDEFKTRAEGKPTKTAIRPGLPLTEDALYR